MIVNHNVKKNQFVGVQRAYFQFAGTGTTTIAVPLVGAKQIRKVSVVTGPNSLALGPLTLTVQQDVATGPIVSLDIKKVLNTFVVADESALDKNFVKMGSQFDGLAFVVANPGGGPDAWSFSIEVVYSARTNINNTVYIDEKVEGLL